MFVFPKINDPLPKNDCCRFYAYVLCDPPPSFHFFLVLISYLKTNWLAKNDPKKENRTENHGGFCQLIKFWKSIDINPGIIRHFLDKNPFTFD